jgi:hypothetical protein
MGMKGVIHDTKVPTLLTYLTLGKVLCLTLAYIK